MKNFIRKALKQFLCDHRNTFIREVIVKRRDVKPGADLLNQTFDEKIISKKSYHICENCGKETEIQSNFKNGKYI